MKMNRRKFIDFLGKGMMAMPLLQVGLAGCGRSSMEEGIKASITDDLLLTEGLDYKVLVKWGEYISDDHYFGFNNDYIAFLPKGDDEGLLWVNHETPSPFFISGYDKNKVARHKNQVRKEMYNVGGSLLKVVKEGKGWKMVKDNANKRITGAQQIAFEWPEPVQGKQYALGTLANCSGGVTPWGTILTCEENYDAFYGEYNYKTGEYHGSPLQWESFTGNPTQHYGWVVEVNPETGESKKHVGLGRFAHECATVVPLADGRVVIYTGDDRNGGCLYKYISTEPGKIYPGQLYVANTEKGSWQQISYENLQYLFESETEMFIRCREAALVVGGTPLDRPEDIDIDPLTGDVIISLTNNKPEGNYFGSLLKIQETGGDYEAMSFSSDTLLAGGEETGFACPDNIAFDKVGNLWFTSDISGSAIGKEPYEPFGNNGLFVLIRNGEQAGKVIRVATAPNDAELTGPCFSPDWKTLFLSVQHPGELSTPGNLTSHWPEGGQAVPKPAVVTITGDFLEQIQGM